MRFTAALTTSLLALHSFTTVAAPIANPSLQAHDLTDDALGIAAYLANGLTPPSNNPEKRAITDPYQKRDLFGFTADQLDEAFGNVQQAAQKAADAVVRKRDENAFSFVGGQLDAALENAQQLAESETDSLLGESHSN